MSIMDKFSKVLDVICPSRRRIRELERDIDETLERCELMLKSVNEDADHFEELITENDRFLAKYGIVE